MRSESETMPIQIPTPAGTFEVFISDKGNVRPLPEGPTTQGDVQIQTSVESANPTIPPRMSIDKTYLVSITLSAAKRADSLALIFGSSTMQPSLFNRDSGQYFDAQTWEDDDTILTFASRDPEYLYSYSIDKKHIPSRYRTTGEYGELDWISDCEQGLKITVPNFQANETVKLFFSLSHAKKHPKNREETTWFAADMALP